MKSYADRMKMKYKEADIRIKAIDKTLDALRVKYKFAERERERNRLLAEANVLKDEKKQLEEKNFKLNSALGDFFNMDNVALEHLMRDLGVY